jgi:hypothetical protein
VPTSAENPPPPPEAPPAKRKWDPPRIQSGQLFESNSLACAKNGPEIEQCGALPPWAS